jgi:hypothetical protein
MYANLPTFFRILLFPLSVIWYMPPDEPGRYQAQAYTASPWNKWVRFSIETTSRRKAYLKARWAALQLEWTALSNECGIFWEVIDMNAKPEDHS